jgi:hypothetical protein
MRFACLQSNLLKTILGGSVLFSLIVGFLCIGFIHVMPAHAGMDMGSMPSHTGHGASLSNCCDTGVNDHMELWKSTLLGIPQGFQDLVLLIVLAVATPFAFAGFLAVPRLDTDLLFYRYRQYVREHPNILTYDPLRLAFARGILHPKTF